MARIRTIKPDFFRHEALQDLESEHPGAYVMLTFAGLWTQCDKAGVFEWRPRSLKLDILPFLAFDLSATLGLLVEAGFVRRFQAEDGREYGLIESFTSHQRIGGKEAQEPPRFPRPGDVLTGKQQGSIGEAAGKHQGLQEGKGKGKEGKGTETRARALTAAPADAVDGLDDAAWQRWLDYRRTIRRPLKPVSIPAAQRELAAFGADQSAVVEQSVAHGWQGLFPLKHVNGSHGPRPPRPSRYDELMAQTGAVTAPETPSDAMLFLTGGKA